MFDCDESGQVGAYKFASKAGFYKCRNVILPFKNLRDCLLNNIDIFQIQVEINNAKPFKCSDIIKAVDMKSQILESVFSKKYMGVMIPVAEINKILGGIRPGELTVIIAHTGSGKTTFSLNLAAWCMQAGMKALILSFEGKQETIVKKIIEISSCESISTYNDMSGEWTIQKSKQWIEDQKHLLSKKELYFLNRASVDKGGYFDIDKLITVIEYAVKFYDISF